MAASQSFSAVVKFKSARRVTAKATPTPDGDVIRMAVQGWVYEKNTGTVAKVKGVFKKTSQTIDVKCGFLNRTQKNIRALRGTMRFTTFFNEPIFDMPLEAVMPITPGERAGMTWKLKREHFASDEAYDKFRKSPLEKMKVQWVPSAIAFEDGTMLQNP